MSKASQTGSGTILVLISKSDARMKIENAYSIKKLKRDPC